MRLRDKVNAVIRVLEQRYIPQFHYTRNDPFAVLVGTIISQRTKEEITHAAFERLFSRIRGPEDLLKMNVLEIAQLIKPAGFYLEKAKRLKELAKIIVEKYHGKVPDSREELLKLPGVGNKTADVVLCYAFNKPYVPVDVHVEVVTKRLGFVDEDAGYAEISNFWIKHVPREKIKVVNLGLVNFGREICRTSKPRCEMCPFTDFCKWFQKMKLTFK